MKRAVLIRLKDNGRQTLGNLQIFDGLVRVLQCNTLEPAWEDNIRNVSCIPDGSYVVTRRRSKKFGEHFHILDIAERDYILIHSGNFRADTSGCVLVGRDFVDINGDGELDVTNSKATLETLLDYLPESFRLDIIAA